MEPSEEIKQKTEIICLLRKLNSFNLPQTNPKIISWIATEDKRRFFFLPLQVHDNHFNFNTTNTLKWGYLGATEFINSVLFFSKGLPLKLRPNYEEEDCPGKDSHLLWRINISDSLSEKNN